MMKKLSNPTALQTVNAIQTRLKLSTNASWTCSLIGGFNPGIKGTMAYAICPVGAELPILLRNSAGILDFKEF